MTNLLSLVGLAAVGVTMYYLLQRSKAEKVVAELEIKPKIEEIAEVEEIAKVTQEVQDAKISYKTAREHYNAQLELQRAAAEQVPGTRSGQADNLPRSSSES